jgi:hypothetical protein
MVQRQGLADGEGKNHSGKVTVGTQLQLPLHPSGGRG